MKKRIFSGSEIDFLRSHYRYDALTGVIILPNGHELVRNSRIQYFYVETAIGWIAVHRLAWILFYHRQPQYTIDHINGNKYDNRIKNLRDVPQSVNNRNRHKSRKTCFKSISAINEENVFYTYMKNTRVGRKFRNIDDAVVFRIRHRLPI